MADESFPADPPPTVDQPPAEAPFVAISERPGAKIDRYKLLEQIGEGGFGVVFTAEQEYPIRRRVALKIIKPGMDTRSVVARFEAERQALAMMDHPNVAKVLDGGSTETGRPYFVMELVRGVPIDEYCDKKKLDVRSRLELFLQVCHAIQHAHQKGLIHRDLKSTNVLVSTHDDQPLAKVIDFGIAKATQSRLTDKTLYTNFQQMIGTPAYMSPEQAEGDFDIDTRTDVYSLGVILYELLVGSLPFDPAELGSKGLVEMQRIIREVEPPLPSTRLSTLADTLPAIAARREVDPAKLKATLRGELDWIVMRCLEKDRKRRYQSVGELSDDIQRYLKDEQVQARPATKMYRLRKFVRRNKSTVIGASAVLLALLAGLGLATVGFIRANFERERVVAALDDARKQRALADDNFREARAAVEDLLQISDERLKDQPGLQPLRMELMKAVIDRYEPFLATPISDPTPRKELARLYARYGQVMLERTEVFDQSVMDEFEKARKLQEQLLQEYPNDRSLRADLGWTLILEEWRSHTMPPSAKQAGRQAVQIFRSLLAQDPNNPLMRDDLVWALWRLSQYTDQTEALAEANQAVAISEQLVSEYPASAEFRRELANSLRMQSGISIGPKPTRQSVAKTMPIRRRALELYGAILDDLRSNRPGVLQPERAIDDEGRTFSDSPLWAEYDMADNSHATAYLYRRVGDWSLATETYGQAITFFKDLVEHNPSVATFTGELELCFRGRVLSAGQENNRKSAAEWSKDAVAFWNRQVELHPDVPDLKTYADDAAKDDAQVAQWLAQPISSPAPITLP